MKNNNIIIKEEVDQKKLFPYGSNFYNLSIKKK
jgi:hypothetical protein